MLKLKLSSQHNKALSINPNQENAWANKEIALRNLNRYQEAINCYDQALSINSKDDNSWYNKGIALENLNNYQEAICCYEKALSINPTQDNAWTNQGNQLQNIIIGIALRNLNKYQEAINFYDQALSINSKDDNAWTDKDNQLLIIIIKELLQFYLNKYQEAICCYEKALSINPKIDNTWTKRVNYIQSHAIIKLFLFKLLLQNQNQKLIHQLNQGINQKLNNFAKQHWSKDQMKRITLVIMKLINQTGLKILVRNLQYFPQSKIQFKLIKIQSLVQLFEFANSKGKIQYVHS
ncbi:unnamed protein product [Paramecium sonneborni]|uniref:Tetratricopeptide repeat protein n=1 Tax=Paramecium sonneborni TaxID=65129 RepID=A0A8S1RPD2_9CILI|nr:unnamed protein product [Paramecium sonneborni]